eukprot:TRINITY_DN3242_c0_g1_i1.p1 TRINITY_DN3242_c0_g1~~TRINITY_DN3242_c0_g1_i1.p1  ORF type:complete len:317 (+),score=79.65 TRINITY_DN3242_c0_g1_i1:54-1004(+)
MPAEAEVARIPSFTSEGQDSADESHADTSEGPASLMWEGVTWALGMRVVTRCPLAGADKRECPEGAGGCVAKLIGEGVMLINVDDPDAESFLCKAEPFDLAVCDPPLLANGTKIRCRPVTLTSATGQTKFVERGTEGLIQEYRSRNNKYLVRLPEHGLTAEIPTTAAVPVMKKKKTSLMNRVLAKLGKGAEKPLSLVPKRSSGKACSPTFSPASAPATPTPGLGKSPAYSSISGSPRSRSRLGHPTADAERGGTPLPLGKYPSVNFTPPPGAALSHQAPPQLHLDANAPGGDDSCSSPLSVRSTGSRSTSVRVTET